MKLTTDPWATRLSLDRLPLKSLWTMQCGVALPGAEPLFRHTGLTRMVLALMKTTAGILIIAFGVKSGPFGLVLLVEGIPRTAGGMHELVFVVAHMASHLNVVRSERWNRFIGNAMAVLVLTAAYLRFRQRHVQRDGHHGRNLAGPGDPGADSLLLLGFTPGQSVRRYWFNLARAFLSPTFYVNSTRERLSDAVSGSIGRLIAIVVVQSLIAAALISAFGLGTYILAWAIPLLVFVPAIGLVQLLLEHRYYDGSLKHSEKTFARIPADPAPEMTFGAILLFTLRYLLIHRPVRMMVLPGDLPVHLIHHDYPRYAWWNSAYVASALEQRNPGYLKGRAGSLFALLNAAFQDFSRQRPYGPGRS